MRWLIIAIGLTLLIWTACVSITISGGDTDNSTDTEIGAEIDIDKDKVDIESNMYKE